MIVPDPHLAAAKEAKGIVGWIAKVGPWLHGIWTAPARLRKLEELVKAAADPRPLCKGCGQGRVGATERRVVYRDAGSRTEHYGQCASCAAWWRMRVEPVPMELIGRKEPAPQQAEPPGRPPSPRGPNGWMRN